MVDGIISTLAANYFNFFLISIMFQNMGGIGNALDQPSQHKLDNLKIIINEVISIVGVAEVKILIGVKFP